MRTRDEREKLFEENRSVAYYVMFQKCHIHNSDDWFEDVEQEALGALWEVTGKWDENRAVFSTLAIVAIERKLWDYMDKQSINRSGLSGGARAYHQARLEKQAGKVTDRARLLTNSTTLTFTNDNGKEQERSDKSCTDSHEGLYAVDARRVIGRAMETLTSQQQEVISMFYGLEDDEPCESYTEIGRRLGISGARVRQIHHLAMARLRHPRNSRKLAELL